MDCEGSVISIRQGDRGPAVEDVQRRLRLLGYDLGPTGVDGVFMGVTLMAVTHFQHGQALAEDGWVGPETWAALVDATFTLGDRLLYLRLPHMHGSDVRGLQGALNALGFACGGPDGIFGKYTERAVREFQRNSGLSPDGIAGSDTVGALKNLKHVWQDKDTQTPSGVKVGTARVAEVLAGVSVAVLFRDQMGREVADRLANLAVAAQECADFRITGARDKAPEADVVLALSPPGSALDPGAPLVSLAADPRSLPNRMMVALSSARAASAPVVMELPEGLSSDEIALQRTAVEILDGLCQALAGGAVAVLR